MAESMLKNCVKRVHQIIAIKMISKYGKVSNGFILFLNSLSEFTFWISLIHYFSYILHDCITNYYVLTSNSWLSIAIFFLYLFKRAASSDASFNSGLFFTFLARSAKLKTDVFIMLAFLIFVQISHKIQFCFIQLSSVLILFQTSFFVH